MTKEIMPRSNRGAMTARACFACGGIMEYVDRITGRETENRVTVPAVAIATEALESLFIYG